MSGVGRKWEFFEGRGFFCFFYLVEFLFRMLGILYGRAWMYLCGRVNLSVYLKRRARNLGRYRSALLGIQSQ